MARASAVESLGAVPTSGRAQWWQVGIGTAAIVVWGLFFDELARVGGWVLDTAYSPLLGQYHDLRIHFVTAGQLLHHQPLYRFGPNADSNPPFAALAFLPFHAVGWRATETIWTVLTMLSLAVILTIALAKWLGVRWSVAWLASGCGLAAASVALCYPIRSLLVWGQLGVVLLAVAMLDLFVVPKRYRGILIGVAAAIKLFPALLIVWFLARRERAAAVRLVASFLVCTVAAWLVWLHASAEYWLHVLPSGTALQLTVDPLRFPVTGSTWLLGVGHLGNQSLRGLLGRPPFVWFGTFPWVVVALVALAVGIATATALLSRRREPTALFVLLVTTVLVSPVSWLHYWVFVVLAPFVAVVEWRRDRAISVAAVVVALATCANLEDAQIFSGPVTSMAPIVLFVVRNLYVLGALGFLVVVALRCRRGTATSPAAVPS